MLAFSYHGRSSLEITLPYEFVWSQPGWNTFPTFLFPIQFDISLPAFGKAWCEDVANCLVAAISLFTAESTRAVAFGRISTPS